MYLKLRKYCNFVTKSSRLVVNYTTASSTSKEECKSNHDKTSVGQLITIDADILVLATDAKKATALSISQVGLVRRIPCTRQLQRTVGRDRKDRQTQSPRWRPPGTKSKPRITPITRITRIITRVITCSLTA